MSWFNYHEKIKIVITIVSIMPRVSLAEKFYEDEENCDKSEGRWLVVYDFHGGANPRFWMNLHRLSSMADGSTLLQLSVYLAATRRVARVAVKLAEHYGASVEVFRVEEDFP